MGALDIPMRNLASTMTGVFGTQVEVELIDPASYNPATRTADADRASVTVHAVLGEWDDREFGDQIKRSEVRVYLPAAKVDQPKNGDQITLDGRRMRVISVRPVYAGGLASIYDCQVRA